MARRERGAHQRCGRVEDRGGRGALRSDPRLVPARRAAADAPRSRADLAPRRRLHRTPAARLLTHVHAFQQLGAEVSVGRRFEVARGAASRQADLPRRGKRDGYRERRDGRGARRGSHRADERRLRAARAGSLPLSRLARRAHRGDRLERAHDRRRGRPFGRRAPDRRRAHRGCELLSASRPSPRAT